MRRKGGVEVFFLAGRAGADAIVIVEIAGVNYW